MNCAVKMPIDKSWVGYNKGEIPNDGFEWMWQDAIPADEPNRDPPVAHIRFGYEETTLPRGWQKTPENMPLELDIIFEKDVEITMRDGVKVTPGWKLLQLSFDVGLDLCRYLSACRHWREESSNNHALLSIWQRGRRCKSHECRPLPRGCSKESTKRTGKIRGVSEI